MITPNSLGKRKHSITTNIKVNAGDNDLNIEVKKKDRKPRVSKKVMTEEEIHIEEFIKINKPLIKQSSITRYRQVLMKLHKELFKDKPIKIDNFNKTELILSYLNTIDLVSKRNYLAGLIALTNNEDYKIELDKSTEDLRKHAEKPEMSDKQKKDMITLEELKDTYEKYEAEANKIYSKIETDKDYIVTLDDYTLLQDYILLALMSCVYIPPRRGADWVHFKVRNFTIKDNFLMATKNQILFNHYKGCENKGFQMVDIPQELTDILLKWVSVNPTDYLIFDREYKQVQVAHITRRFYTIFYNKHRRTSINDIRHAYVTETLGKDFINKMDSMTDMGSSVNQVKTYVKFH